MSGPFLLIVLDGCLCVISLCHLVRAATSISEERRAHSKARYCYFIVRTLLLRLNITKVVAELVRIRTLFGWLIPLNCLVLRLSALSRPEWCCITALVELLGC